MTDMSIPYGVSLEGFIDVIAAWYRAKGYNQPLKNSDVAERIESSAKLESRSKIVSNQSSFLTQIGILKKIGQQNQLTELGHIVSQMADYSQDREFNETMKKILIKWKEVIPLIEFLFHRVTMNRAEYVERIVAEAGKSMETKNASMGGEALVSLMERCGIVEINDQGLVSLNSDVKDAFEDGKLSPEPSQTVVANKKVGNSIIDLKIQVQFTVEGNFESQDTEVIIDKLKRMLEKLQYELIEDDQNH